MLGVFGLGGSASKRRRPSLDGGLVPERPRLCENSIKRGQPRNDVLPQARMRYFVPVRAATDSFLRKLFSSDSRNWSFHTASAPCCLSASVACCSAASTNWKLVHRAAIFRIGDAPIVGHVPYASKLRFEFTK